MTRRVRVIACGNDQAGDDAAGLLAVRSAAPALSRIDGVEVVEAGAGLNAVHLFAEVDAVVVVDAIRTRGRGRLVGELVRVEVGRGGLPGVVTASLSSHGFGVAEAIGLASALDDLPPVVVLGIEVGQTTEGRALSPPVERALDALAAAIVTEARRLSSP